MNAADFVAAIYRDLRQAVDGVRADRSIAQGTQNAGLITIQRLTETSPDLEALARIKGFATADQDEVVTLQMKGGKEFVLGTLQRTAPTGYTLDAGLAITGASSVSGGAFTANAGIVNSDVIQPNPNAQDASDTPTSSAVSTYQNAMTYNLTLPSTGTFTVTALFFLQMKRNPAGVAALRGNINGTAGGARQVNCDLNVYTLHAQWHQVTGIAGGTVVPLICQFVGNSGVTLTSTIEPMIAPWITRTS